MNLFYFMLSLVKTIFYRITFCLFIYIIVIILIRESDSHELNQIGITQRLTSLECKRDDAFVDVDSLCIERLTRQICVLLIKDDNIFNNEFQKCICSIIKTRHLFPGKVDILRDFYMTESLESSILKQNLKYILISDTIADLSIKDINFYELFEDTLKTQDYFSLKRKIMGNINKNIESNFIIKNFEINIEKELSDIDLIMMIYELEKKFAPTITFKRLYNYLMVTPNFNDYEVIGLDKYIYWPSDLQNNERNIVQKFVSKNDLCGRFKPLSLVNIKIDSTAIEHFQDLKNRKGSFIPYLSNKLDGIESTTLLLVSEKNSDVEYNPRNLMKLYSNYEIKKNPIFTKSKEELRYYAEQGVVTAAYEYALILSDFPLYFYYLEYSAMQENIKAQEYIGYMFLMGIDVNEDLIESARWYHRAADLGSAKSQYNLGIMYHKGIGVLKNETISVKWHTIAANQGHVEAQYNLGIMHSNGIGVLKDEAEAIQWYILAANQGHIKAQYNLGIMHSNGIGVLKDETEAIQWYILAANQGHIEAQYNLGSMYSNGIGVLKDEIEAIQWYILAANQGHVEAQYNLGIMHSNGIGVLKNETKAAKWYILAANQGHVEAQYNLGVMYRSGIGILKNETKAAKWYILAANQGHTGAQYNLGVMYKRGIGVSQNIMEGERLHTLVQEHEKEEYPK